MDFDGFNDGCLLVINTLEAFMEDMDAKKEGMYEEKYDKVRRMLSGMKATVGDRIEAGKQSDIEVPSQKIILPN